MSVTLSLASSIFMMLPLGSVSLISLVRRPPMNLLSPILPAIELSLPESEMVFLAES